MIRERRGAFQFLDTEWRRNVWQRWLGNIFLPPVPPHPPQPEPAPVADTIAPAAASDTAEVEPRRQRRSRFDALLTRMSDIEDALDALNSRVASRLSHDRRSDDTTDLMESLTETAERQTAAIEGLVFSIERVDERLERLERGLLRGSEQRLTQKPARRSSPPEQAEEEPARASRTTGSWATSDLDVSSGSSMHGSLTDMSLSTVMAMLELERRTGRLRVSDEDGSLACFELRDGAVAASRINESDIDSVDCLRQVLGWGNGRFWFRQSQDDSPRPVGSLLLEATRQNDEARAEAR
jgi:hypothetical protein